MARASYYHTLKDRHAHIIIEACAIYRVSHRELFQRLTDLDEQKGRAKYITVACAKRYMVMYLYRQRTTKPVICGFVRIPAFTFTRWLTEEKAARLLFNSQHKLGIL